MTTIEDRARAIFLAALERAPDQWPALLEQACGNQTDLWARVDQLLQAHQALGSIQDRGAGDPATTIDVALREAPGMVIGPYKLLEQIGEGGFGVVFMAEQQEPIRRKVALKVIKPGMDTRQVIARFDAERQALALMDHPNIARVLDAGTTGAGVPASAGSSDSDSEDRLKPGLQPGGRPYFVMELVRGLSMTEHCDRNNLPIRERLELFVDVCQAVQHAHQKGIIHRDIKPSNVMVTLHDDKPLVKVIDFGIAKAIGQQLTEKTLFTNFAQMIGTPLYMSPEQAEMSGLDVDTRSDIYSLGVLLYELLTGTTPFDKQRLRMAGYDEIRRIIREEEPPKPSTRIRTLKSEPRTPVSESEQPLTTVRATMDTIAAQRKSDPKRLSQLLRRELDWIVMKCLEKERNRRYETANGLARDIQRYLHDEPVLACPPSRLYRVRKFARRHTVALGVASLLAASLVASVLILAISYVRVAQEKKQKEEAAEIAGRQQQRAEENLRLALQALDGIYLQVAEDSLPRDPQRKKEDTELLRKALDFYQQFAQKNNAAPSVRLEVSRAYRRVGDIQEFVGEHTAAQQAYKEAITGAQELATGFPTEPEYSGQLAICHNRLGEALAKAGAMNRAEEHFQQAIDLLTLLTAEDPAAASYWAELARSHYDLGELRKQQGERSAGEDSYQQALVIQSSLAADVPTVARYRLDLADMHRGLGNWMEGGHAFSMTPEGDEHARTACRILGDLVAEFPENPLYRHRLATALGQMSTHAGDWSENVEGYQRAIDLFMKLADQFPQVPTYRSGLAVCYGNLGEGLRMNGDWDEAAEYWRKSLDLSTKLAAEYPSQRTYKERLGWALGNWAQMCVYQGNFADARKCAEESLSYAQPLRKTNPNNAYFAEFIVGETYLLAAIAEALGDHAEAVKRREEAEEAFAEACSQLHKDRGPAIAAGFCADLATELGCIGRAWKRQGKQREAAIIQGAVANVSREAVRLKPEDAEVHFKLGNALGNSGLLEEAIAEYQKAIRLKKDYPEAHCNLGVVLYEKGQLKEAITEYQEAIRIKPDLWQAHVNLGIAHALLGQWEQAVADYSKVIDLHPKYRKISKLRNLRGDAYKELREYGKAIEDYAKAIESVDPRNAAAWNHLAGLLTTWPDSTGPHRRQAVELAKKAVELAPKEGIYWNTLGAAHCCAGNFKEAVAAFEKSIELEPKNAGAWYNRGLAFGELHQYDKAIADLNKVLEPDPKIAWAALNKRGDAYKELHEYGKAIADYTKAIESVDPKNAAAWNDLAWRLTTWPDSTGPHRCQAIELAKKAVELAPKEANYWNTLGWAHEKCHQYEQALADFNKAIELDRKYSAGWNNLAWLLSTWPDTTRRDPRRAVESAEKAVELAPKEGNYWNTLGAAHYRAENFKEALAALEKSMELREGGDSSDWFFLAMSYWHLGEKEKASTWYEKAVDWMDKNDPKNEELLRFRAEAAELLGTKEEKTHQEDTKDTKKKP
jgi:tetratricopeptide (TPR) repeat protein/serine/threonine protein kinase